MKITEIDFDQAILKKFEDSSYKKIISDSLDAYKKIFLLVYDKYNLRFKEIYNEDLSILHYYLKLLEFFNKKIDIIVKEAHRELSNRNPKTFKSEKQAMDNFNKQNSALMNAQIHLVNDENEYKEKIKAANKGKKHKYLHLGFFKKEIFKQIDILIFHEVEYFINMAQHKKFIQDPFKKNYSDFTKFYIHYEMSLDKPTFKTKNKEIITSIRKVKKDWYVEKASSSHSYYQQYRKFIKANKNLSNFNQHVNEIIIKNLRGLD